MDDDAEFRHWFETTWHDAEMALHNGDARPRFETWSTHEPVTLFGAWMNATNADEAREVFRRLEQSFADVEEGQDLAGGARSRRRSGLHGPPRAHDDHRQRRAT